MNKSSSHQTVSMHHNDPEGLLKHTARVVDSIGLGISISKQGPGDADWLGTTLKTIVLT